jgi:dihydroxy-acid dehydratase
MSLRSAAWFGGQNVSGLLHRASLRAGGGPDDVEGKPVIGLCSSYSELVHCNVHLRLLADSVRRGVLEAGGVPVEFPTISLSENLMKPTTMLFRNLMAMDVEEMIRSHPLDAVVLMGGCDKTIPAQLMGAVSAGVPAIVLPGGPSAPARFRGRDLGVGTDLWHYTDDVRSGRMSLREFRELERQLIPTHGHCNEMGSASTIAALTEALGFSLMGSSMVPAVSNSRAAIAEATGRRAVEIATEELSPRTILTPESLDNAITLLSAIGGSTNAIIHLTAIAGRRGIDLPLDRFGEISARTPRVTNVRPSGEYLTGELAEAGGIPAVLAALAELLNLDATTVSGRTLGEEIAGAAGSDPRVIGTLAEPIGPPGALAVLTGSLAPRGAVLKRSAATESLLAHRGRAVVFDGIEDALDRIDDPELDVDRDSVLVLRGVGPVGVPGMPEWGMLPIPSKLLRQGVTDMVRISDARMSGTAFGTVVLHVTPEAAIGGPLARIRDGDGITLDVPAGRIDVEVDPAELAARPVAEPAAGYRPTRGYQSLYQRHVLQADQGCDFDFLRSAPGDSGEPAIPVGLFSGWFSGW